MPTPRTFSRLASLLVRIQRGTAHGVRCGMGGSHGGDLDSDLGSLGGDLASIWSCEGSSTG